MPGLSDWWVSSGATLFRASFISHLMLRSEAVSLWISLAAEVVQKAAVQHQLVSAKTEVSSAKAQKRKEREVKVSKNLLCDLCAFALEAQSARLG